MPKLTSFLICNSVENALGSTPEQTVPALVAPQIAIRPEYIPSNFSFGIAVGVAGVNPTEENNARIVIEDPDGKVVYDSGINQLPKGPSDDILPEDYCGFMLTADLRNLPLEKDGCFVFKLYLNDSIVGEKDIPVYKKGK